MAKSKVQIVETNLNKVQAYATKAAKLYQDAQAEVIAVQVELDQARAAYVDDPSDSFRLRQPEVQDLYVTKN